MMIDRVVGDAIPDRSVLAEEVEELLRSYVVAVDTC